ncbi:MAG TPA: hypothetical protein VGG74_14170 [Kofleriaceae bacterium]|jgi:hypothetical protein
MALGEVIAASVCVVGGLAFVVGIIVLFATLATPRERRGAWLGVALLMIVLGPPAVLAAIVLGVGPSL